MILITLNIKDYIGAGEKPALFLCWRTVGLMILRQV
jgi:hypothetical protein